MDTTEAALLGLAKGLVAGDGAYGLTRQAFEAGISRIAKRIRNDAKRNKVVHPRDDSSPNRAGSSLRRQNSRRPPPPAARGRCRRAAVARAMAYSIARAR